MRNNPATFHPLVLLFYKALPTTKEKPKPKRMKKKKTGI